MCGILARKISSFTFPLHHPFSLAPSLYCFLACRISLFSFFHAIIFASSLPLSLSCVTERALSLHEEMHASCCTPWSTPKDDEHTHNYTHMFKRRRRMRNKRENALNHSKTHIQPFGGRKECSYTFRDALWVPIYWLQRRNDGERDPSSSLRETSTTRVQPIFPFFYFHISLSKNFEPFCV